MNFDAKNPVLDKKWNVDSVDVTLTNRICLNGMSPVKCEPYIAIDDDEDTIFCASADHAVRIAQALLSAAAELRPLEAPPVYVLWTSNFENRSGEDFVHAWTGLPSKEQMEKHTGLLLDAQYNDATLLGKHIQVGNPADPNVYWLVKHDD
ncbi:hypothetical protein Vid5_gp74 [Pantoea phage vB_PagS_Vid5]|uniref:Uncharacterized protein n=1 Tax=Pantoea phage vB_PagS_Vid5 TaxID=2099652 RepID=A0A2P1CKU8_9CAUD|nr:hypothetical protein FDJ45_gp081 [Pantoea phage vB_PagS_Vid5]AVJ51829.1 hypothetical protein Vid5_gp74 [Pantoea phage vB_PagS_Vid5]